MPNWSTKNLSEILKRISEALIQAFSKRKPVVNNKVPSPEVVIAIDKQVEPKAQETVTELLTQESVKTEELPAQKVKSEEELEGEQIMNLLKQGGTNPASSEVTKRLRKFINYEFKFLNEPNFDKTQLQCTEYAHFRVKQKLGATIQWPPTRPRNGKDWPDRLSQSNFCRVLDDPVQNCTMSFTDGFKTPVTQQAGHVAFVEEICPDGKIRISEANWDNKGSYQERKLTEDEWRNKWGGKFIDFS